MSLSRRGLFSLAAGATLTLAACGQPAATSSPGGSPSASGGSLASGSRQATIGLTYIPNVQFSPCYVGLAHGLFSRAGADVTLRHHGAQEGLFTALVGGQEDFVVAGADEMLQARATGADLVAIAPYYRQFPAALLVLAESGIKTLADLKGRSVGVPGKYGESWFALLVALKEAGLTERDVKVVEIGYTQQAALSGRKVDSIIGFTNNDLVNFTANGVPARAIAVSATQVPLVGASLITTRKLLTERPELARRVATGLQQAIAAVVADPAQALTDSLEFIPALKTDPAAKKGAEATLTATVPLFQDAAGGTASGLDAAQFQAMAAFMAEQGLTPTLVDATAAMQNVAS